MAPYIANIFLQKWKWDEFKYQIFFSNWSALTNCSIIFNGLRAIDRNLYTVVHNSVLSIGENTCEKQTISQAKYREKRQNCLLSNLNTKNSIDI